MFRERPLTDQAITNFLSMQENISLMDITNKDHQRDCFTKRRLVYGKYLDQIRPKQ